VIDTDNIFILLLMEQFTKNSTAKETNFRALTKQSSNFVFGGEKRSFIKIKRFIILMEPQNIMNCTVS